MIQKVAAADAVVWLDEVQYTHGGWTNRNRLPDGGWLTVPVDRSTDMAAMNRVRIAAGEPWRRSHCRSLAQAFGPGVDGLCSEIMRPYRLLVGVNLAILRIVTAHLDAAWHFQSHLDGGSAVAAVSEDRCELLPISERLAMMVAEVGGDVYLSGPSGRGYLDERPFGELGIRVDYFEWRHQTSPCSAALLTLDRRTRRVALAGAAA